MRSSSQALTATALLTFSYDSAYPFIYYDYDYKSDLKNGDKYTVTANIDVYGAEESGDMTWFEYDDKYYTYKTADVRTAR